MRKKRKPVSMTLGLAARGCQEPRKVPETTAPPSQGFHLILGLPDGIPSRGDAATPVREPCWLAGAVIKGDRMGIKKFVIAVPILLAVVACGSTAPRSRRPGTRGSPAATRTVGRRRTRRRCGTGNGSRRWVWRGRTAGATRGWHRRVPVLPDRPEAHRGRVPDRQPVPAAERRHRAPRHLLPDPRRRCGRGEEPRRRDQGRRLAVLRRQRARRRRSVHRCLGARPAETLIGDRAGYEMSRVARSCCRCTTTCWPPTESRRGRPVHDAPAADVRNGGRDAARGRVAARADRAALHARGVRTAL